MSERAGHYAGREQVIASLLWYGYLDRVSCHPHRVALNLGHIPSLFG